MTALSHMNGWVCHERGRRKTRRERELPKLRGDGTKARTREFPPHYRCHMSASIVTVHRQFVRDLYAHLGRIKRGRYCWAPARWQLAMMEAQDGP